jgi:hypothetical protein
MFFFNYERTLIILGQNLTILAKVWLAGIARFLMMMLVIRSIALILHYGVRKRIVSTQD